MTRQRQRQANGRPYRVRINVTGEQLGRWRDLAATDQVTLPRWIVDRVENKPAAALRRVVRSEVNAIRLMVRGCTANLNQLAHQANMGDIDLAGWDDAVAEIQRQGDLLNDLIDHLSS